MQVDVYTVQERYGDEQQRKPCVGSQLRKRNQRAGFYYGHVTNSDGVIAGVDIEVDSALVDQKYQQSVESKRMVQPGHRRGGLSVGLTRRVDVRQYVQVAESGKMSRESLNLLYVSKTQCRIHSAKKRKFSRPGIKKGASAPIFTIYQTYHLLILGCVVVVGKCGKSSYCRTSEEVDQAVEMFLEITKLCHN